MATSERCSSLSWTKRCVSWVIVESSSQICRTACSEGWALCILDAYTHSCTLQAAPTPYLLGASPQWGGSTLRWVSRHLRDVPHPAGTYHIPPGYPLDPAGHCHILVGRDCIPQDAATSRRDMTVSQRDATISHGTWSYQVCFPYVFLYVFLYVFCMFSICFFCMF
jgi:hypothetical protein